MAIAQNQIPQVEQTDPIGQQLLDLSSLSAAGITGMSQATDFTRTLAWFDQVEAQALESTCVSSSPLSHLLAM